MKAIVSVLGSDKVGILANVAVECSKANANVIEVNQSVLQNMFAMTMLVDITELNIDLKEFSDRIQKVGEKMGLSTHVMHEDIFNSMHRI